MREYIGCRETTLAEGRAGRFSGQETKGRGPADASPGGVGPRGRVFGHGSSLTLARHPRMNQAKAFDKGMFHCRAVNQDLSASPGACSDGTIGTAARCRGDTTRDRSPTLMRYG